MANDNSRPDVAVFIDFENVYVSVRDKLDANPDFESIMDRCSELGRVVISRAYADWYRYPRVTSALYANGVEPMYVPTYYYDKEMGRTGRAIKNSADMNMCIDAMKTLFTNTNIAKFVLVTGDRDFIPLVNMIRQQGKDVIIIGIGGAASSHLAQSADEFIFYEQLIGKIPAPMGRDANRDRQRNERSRPVETEAEAYVAPAAPVAPTPPVPPVAPVAPPVPEHPAEPDPFDTLVEAVHLARKRGYVCTLGSLKLVMKELMGGDFKESRYKDLSGRPFAKFKDFVLDAERRGKVQIFTNGTINEVFLPNEDPYKLSQFAGDVKEEPAEVVVETPVAPVTNGRRPVAPIAPAEPASNGRSRRRRRSRGGRPVEQASAEVQAPNTDSDEIEELEEAPLNVDNDELVTDADELVAALMPDDFFDVDAIPVDLIEADGDVGSGLLIPDELIDLPGDDDVTEQDLADLDTLEPLDKAEEDVVEVEAAPEVQQPDEVEQPTDGGASDETGEVEAAPGAELPEYEQTFEAVTPEVEQAEHEQAMEQAQPEEVQTTSEDEQAQGGQALAEDVTATPEVELAEHEQAAASITSADSIMSEDAVSTSVEEEQATPSVEEAQDETVAAPEQVQSTPEQPQAEVAAEAEPTTDDEQSEAADAVAEVTFTDEEWQTFRELMSGFTRPVSFAHIFDSLRTFRQQQRLTRTNEQLRTLVKQAINTGLLERSGRGTRVYYRLAENV